jgi:hypothetical protein
MNFACHLFTIPGGMAAGAIAFNSDSADRQLLFAPSPLRLNAVGLHQTTRYRATVVLDAAALNTAKAVASGEGHFHAAFPPRLGER